MNLEKGQLKEKILLSVLLISPIHQEPPGPPSEIRARGDGERGLKGQRIGERREMEKGREIDPFTNEHQANKSHFSTFCLHFYTFFYLLLFFPSHKAHIIRPSLPFSSAPKVNYSSICNNYLWGGTCSLQITVHVLSH